MGGSFHFIDQGVCGITLCDTTGMAYPSQVTSLIGAVRSGHPDAELSLHFHNTWHGIGQRVGRYRSESSSLRRFARRIGGCPCAPGASGNVCTEDLVHALDLMGYDTGINQAVLIDSAKLLPALQGHNIPDGGLAARVSMPKPRNPDRPGVSQ